MMAAARVRKRGRISVEELVIEDGERLVGGEGRLLSLSQSLWTIGFAVSAVARDVLSPRLFQQGTTVAVGRVNSAADFHACGGDTDE